MTPFQLRQVRQKLGLSQGGLASALGVERNTVTRWESGRHPISEPMGKLIRLLHKTAVRPPAKAQAVR